MKATFSLLLLLALFGGKSSAAVIITLNQNTLAGGPGDTVSFRGSIQNTGADQVFLNGVNDTLEGSSFVVDVTDPFLANVPVSLGPGAATRDIELIHVSIGDPFRDLSGTFTGMYSLLGGSDASAQDLLATVNFYVSVAAPIPEPASGVLMVVGLGIGLLRLGKRRPRGRPSTGSGCRRFEPGGLRRPRWPVPAS